MTILSHHNFKERKFFFTPKIGDTIERSLINTFEDFWLLECVCVCVIFGFSCCVTFIKKKSHQGSQAEVEAEGKIEKRKRKSKRKLEAQKQINFRAMSHKHIQTSSNIFKCVVKPFNLGLAQKSWGVYNFMNLNILCWPLYDMYLNFENLFSVFFSFCAKFWRIIIIPVYELVYMINLIQFDLKVFKFLFRHSKYFTFKKYFYFIQVRLKMRMACNKF